MVDTEAVVEDRVAADPATKTARTVAAVAEVKIECLPSPKITKSFLPKFWFDLLFFLNIMLNR